MACGFPEWLLTDDEILEQVHYPINFKDVLIQFRAVAKAQLKKVDHISNEICPHFLDKKRKYCPSCMEQLHKDSE